MVIRRGACRIDHAPGSQNRIFSMSPKGMCSISTNNMAGASFAIRSPIYGKYLMHNMPKVEIRAVPHRYPNRVGFQHEVNQESPLMMLFFIAMEVVSMHAIKKNMAKWCDFCSDSNLAIL